MIPASCCKTAICRLREFLLIPILTFIHFRNYNYAKLTIIPVMLSRLDRGLVDSGFYRDSPQLEMLVSRDLYMFYFVVVSD